jgi:hypothetical protein
LWFSCSAGRWGVKNEMVMLVQHTEIMTRHKDKAILYWFGPPESKTLRLVLRFVLLVWRDYMATCRWSTSCPREDTLARLILNVTLTDEASSVSSCFMNSYHYFWLINGCLVNGPCAVEQMSLGPLLSWVLGPATPWAPGTTRLGLHDT